MDKKVLRWNFVFQYGWVITNIISSIILLPLYVKHIDGNTLGLWLATTSILYWMTIIDPGIGEVLQQKIAELRGKNEYAEIGTSIGSGLVSSMFILLFAVIFGVICYFALGIIIDKDVTRYPDLSKALFITILSTGLSLVSFTLTGINQGLHNSAQVAISSLTANLLFLLVNLFFLYKGYGVMSIAIANLSRASYINLYNYISLKKVLKKDDLAISFSKVHFKKFIKIFSFTSVSRIVTGLSNSVDMIVLARFISPAMITTYEINKRPVNLTSSLIGRHSVALMPLISHAKGMGNKTLITNLINRQFKLYLYAALFTAFIFAINYSNLINLWIGEGKFIGNNLLILLLLYQFFNLMGYFMSNVGYALGDIKINSAFLIIRNIIYSIIIFFGAKLYGIVGTIAVAFAFSFLADFFFFSYRVYKLGYLQLKLMKDVLNICITLLPACILFGWFLHIMVEKFLVDKLLITKMIISSAAFTLFFMMFVLIIDGELRNTIKQFKNKIFFRFA